MQRNMILRHAPRQAHARLPRRARLRRGRDADCLIKSTPEGARDFLVPSSGFPGNFYALPQSPQQLKQLLMVAGLRPLLPDRPLLPRRSPARRPPAGVHPARRRDDVRRPRRRDDLIEQLYIELTERFSDKRIRETPFPRLTYQESMDRFGNDRPDLRFGLELQDVSEALRGHGVSGLRPDVSPPAARSRRSSCPAAPATPAREIDEVTELAKRAGAKGLATIRPDGRRQSARRSPSSSAKRSSPPSRPASAPTTGDLVLLVADQPVGRGQDALGAARRVRAAGSDWPIRTCSPTAGSTSSRCSNGTTRRTAGTPPTIPSPATRGGRAPAADATPARSAPSSTTSSATATSSAAAASATTGAPIRSESSR